MNIEKHYEKYEQSMRKDNRWPCPEKIWFDMWEESKKKEKKDDNTK